MLQRFKNWIVSGLMVLGMGLLAYFWRGEAVLRSNTQDTLQYERHRADTLVLRVDTLRGEVNGWKGVAKDWEFLAVEARSKAAGIVQKINTLADQITTNMGMLSRKDQQIRSLKNMVELKVLPPERLPDTTKRKGVSFVTTPEYDRGVVETSERAKLYKKSLDSVALVASDAVGQVEGFKQQAKRSRDKEENASRYTQGKLEEVAGTKWYKRPRKIARKAAEEVRKYREANEPSEIEDYLNKKRLR